MSMSVLRRMRHLASLSITTSPAPPVLHAVDVPSPPSARPNAGPLVPVPPAVAPRPAPVPPVRLRGVCYHDGHVEHSSVRYGVQVLDDERASLLRCPFTNRDGQ